MAIGKKAARKVKKAVKNPSLQKAAKSTVKLLVPDLHPTVRVASKAIKLYDKGARKLTKAALGMRGTGKGRGARRLPPGALGPVAAGLKPMKTLASKGTRGLPEQQEARRRRVTQRSKTRTRKSY